MVRLVQPLQRLRRSRLKMHLSLNARVIQHRGEAKPAITRCFRCISPLATAGLGPHLSPARITEEALIKHRAPPTRWHLTISVYSSTSEQPLLHLSYARRFRLHRCPACKGSSISGPSLPSDNLLAIFFRTCFSELIMALFRSAGCLRSVPRPCFR